MADVWKNIADKIAGLTVPSADWNSMMANIRLLGGNGTSAPSTDIETLFNNAVSFTSQAGPPSSTPSALGQFNLDTTATRLYISTGTSSSADWDKMPYVDYGVVTVTSGGGDITVDLPQAWEGGMLFLWATETSSEYFGDDTFIRQTTYDALTNEEATYTGNQVWAINSTTGNIGVNDKGDDFEFMPKSATTKSFTVNDSDTRYVKWMVIA